MNSISSAVLPPSLMVVCHLQGLFLAFQQSCTFIHLTCNVAASASPSATFFGLVELSCTLDHLFSHSFLYTVHILLYIPQTQISYAKYDHIWDIQSSGKGDVRKRIACGLGGVEISLGHSTCSLWKPSWRLWNKFHWNLWGSEDFLTFGNAFRTY